MVCRRACLSSAPDTIIRHALAAAGRFCIWCFFFFFFKELPSISSHAGQKWDPKRGGDAAGIPLGICGAYSLHSLYNTILWGFDGLLRGAGQWAHLVLDVSSLMITLILEAGFMHVRVAASWGIGH